LAVHQRGARGAETADLRVDGVGHRERAVPERVVMTILGECRERERSAHRRLQLAASDGAREFEVAYERLSVGRDRSGDHRLPEICVVVVETLQRPPVAAFPRARERREHVVPADLTVIDHIHADPVELADGPPRAFIEHARQALGVELAAVVTVERPAKVLMLVGDLGVRADDGRLHGFDSFTLGRGKRPARSATSGTASGHSMAYRCTPRTPGRARSDFTISTAIAVPSCSASAAFFSRSTISWPSATPGTRANRSACSAERRMRTPAMTAASRPPPTRRSSASHWLNVARSKTGCVCRKSAPEPTFCTVLSRSADIGLVNGDAVAPMKYSGA